MAFNVAFFLAISVYFIYEISVQGIGQLTEGVDTILNEESFYQVYEAEISNTLGLVFVIIAEFYVERYKVAVFTLAVQVALLATIMVHLSKANEEHVILYKICINTYFIFNYGTTVIMNIIVLDQLEPYSVKYKYAFACIYFMNYFDRFGEGVWSLVHHVFFKCKNGTVTCDALMGYIYLAMGVFSLALFIYGRAKFNRVSPPIHNAIIRMIKCFRYAWRKYKHDGRRPPVLEHALPAYSLRLVNDIRRSRVLAVILSLLLAAGTLNLNIYDWANTASKLSCIYRSKEITKTQLRLIVCVANIFYIPIVYIILVLLPLKKYVIFSTNLRMVGLGLCILMVSHICGIVLSTLVESTAPRLPMKGRAHFRIYNTLDCDIKFDVPLLVVGEYEIPSLEHIEFFDIITEGPLKCPYKFTCGKTTQEGELIIQEGVSNSFYLNKNKELKYFEDDVSRDEGDMPKLRLLASTESEALVAYVFNEKIVEGSTSQINQIILPDYYFNFTINGTFQWSRSMNTGGVYVILMNEISPGKYKYNIVTVTPPNPIPAALILPQYLTYVTAYWIFFTYGENWFYVQAPTRLKVLMVYIWFYAKLLGLVIYKYIIQRITPSNKDSLRHILYLVYTLLGAILFGITSIYYDYIDVDDDSDRYSDDSFLEDVEDLPYYDEIDD